jgi:stress response protein YsnF
MTDPHRTWQPSGDEPGSNAESEPAVPASATGLGGSLDETVSVVRSEEELAIEKRAVPYERVRLVKRIVTEQVTLTVDVRREELAVVRDAAAPHAAEEPGVDAAPPQAGLLARVRDRLPVLRSSSTPRVLGGEPFAAETLDVTLMQEDVVVTKRIVPRERVRLRKEAVTEQSRVSEQVRKEHVDVESGASHSVAEPRAATPEGA